MLMCQCIQVPRNSVCQKNKTTPLILYYALRRYVCMNINF